MDYQSALAKLWNHANMPTRELAEATAEGSFVYKLYKCNNDRHPFNLIVYVNDMIDCLEAINKELNGETPADNPAPRPPVDRGVALAVSSVIHDGWKYHLIWESRNFLHKGSRDQLAQALWAISCAWVLVLHGDIDSIRDYVEYERAALGLGHLGTEEGDRTGEVNPCRA